LQQCHRDLAGWATDLGETPLDLGRGHLQELFMHGVNRSESGKVIKELGYSLTLNHGTKTYDWVQANIRCGGYSSLPNIVNGAFISLPEAAMITVANAPTMKEVLRTTVFAWEPDWGAVVPLPLDSNAVDPTVPTIGWMTYLSKRRGLVPELLPDFEVLALEDYGTIIVTCSERYDRINDIHRERADKLQSLLGAAGLLESMAVRRVT